MAALPAPIQVSPTLLEQVYREARRSFPYECCGWLAGPRDGPAVDRLRPCVNDQELGEHPVTPERGAESAYVFSVPDRLALARSEYGAQPARIIYHSHPNGQAYFSPTDRQVARSPWGDGPAYPVQQLVVGIDAQRVVEAALFAWSDEAGDFVEIAKYQGAAI